MLDDDESELKKLSSIEDELAIKDKVSARLLEFHEGLDSI